MSEGYARATMREGRIWTPFGYAFPFFADQVTDRATIFGLYSGSYLNYHRYLNEIETDELANLLADYNSKIADLTAQEQNVVADIVSKRYISGIERIIHEQKLATKSADIAADGEMWTAKIAALASDRAALDTLSAKVTSETEKTAARITELEAYIEMEGIHLSLADVEITEKEIQSAKVDIEKLNASNAILKIQVDTVNVAAQLVDVDHRIARTKAEEAQIDANIAKIGLLDGELEIATAHTSVSNAETNVAQARLSLTQARGEIIDSEIAQVEAMEGQAVTELANKTDLLNARNEARITEGTEQTELRTQDLARQKTDSELDVTLATNDQTLQPELDQLKVNKWGYALSSLSNEINATIAALDQILSAEIKTKLTHTIGKKP